MENFELPKSFDEFVDARKAGFLRSEERRVGKEW